MSDNIFSVESDALPDGTALIGFTGKRASRSSTGSDLRHRPFGRRPRRRRRRPAHARHRSRRRSQWGLAGGDSWRPDRGRRPLRARRSRAGAARPLTSARAARAHAPQPRLHGAEGAGNPRGDPRRQWPLGRRLRASALRLLRRRGACLSVRGERSRLHLAIDEREGMITSSSTRRGRQARDHRRSRPTKARCQPAISSARCSGATFRRATPSAPSAQGGPRGRGRSCSATTTMPSRASPSRGTRAPSAAATER